jgi:hypothetical protein
VNRGWTDVVARVGDTIPLSLAALLLLAVAGLVGSALHWWPAWLPWRWWSGLVRAIGRLRLPRLRWRRRRPAPEAVAAVDEPDVVDGNGLPDLPAGAFQSLADRLAAQGRYAEAVRERLRGILRELVDRGILQNRPGWTVTELAAAAAAGWPPVRPPLDSACDTFSVIWYGQLPATAVHDGQMREYADRVHAAMLAPAGGPR